MWKFILASLPLSPSIKHTRAFTYVPDDISFTRHFSWLACNFLTVPTTRKCFPKWDFAWLLRRVTGFSTLERFPPSPNPLFPRPGRYGALSHRERPSIPDSALVGRRFSTLRFNGATSPRSLLFPSPLLFLARISYLSLARDAIFPDFPTSSAGRF